MSLKHSLSSYWTELKFAVTRSVNPIVSSRLLLRTAQFHLLNRLPNAKRSKEFRVRVRLPGGLTDLTLRTAVGDIYIFYEVLADQVYKLPPSFADPATVRTIVDCGGNIGMTALYLADAFPQARIFSIEPHPENFRLLQANTHSRANITPIHGCICGHTPGTRVLSMDRPAWGNSLVDSGEGLEVPAHTIESLMQTYGLEKIDLLKVDIEGAEREVFAHPQFLSKVGSIIIELHGDYTPDKFQNDIHPMGFNVHLPGPGSALRMITASRSR